MSFFAGYLLGLEEGGSPAIIQPLTVTKNGKYDAPAGVDGFNPVLVNVPEGSGGIWDMFNGREPLAVITLGSNTAVHILNMGNPLSSFVNYSQNGILVNEGNYTCPVAVLKYNNKDIAYYTDSYTGSGYSDIKEYTLIGDIMFMTFQRTVKIGATKVSRCLYRKSGKNISLNLTIKFFLDYLNFSQFDYDDGSHWEETYAWHSSAFTFDFHFTFNAYESYTLNYSTNVLGDTISAQNAIWVPVSKDVIENSEKGFPTISYTKPEDHFDNDFYTNDTAKGHGYYDSNVAYMNKWGKPELWE